MKIQWSLILALIFALITAVFAVINVDPVQVNLLFGSVSLPLILLILGSTLLGGIIVGSFGIYRGYRLQREVKGLHAKLVHIQEATGYIFPETEKPERGKKKKSAENETEPGTGTEPVEEDSPITNP
ncbi:lipopolysaccharide assembly protein LapA domain-containing protein [Paenibacillus timonensis]|jgi:lipopolysaccharide assembly protein A|uniref:Lipopolysaccharide assembly LapA domain-containing protein n=1 Tax=Paenibacillus timonensis TaxID=225915 RepID=A0ABW3SCR7_9BACL|nr:MULTISPECIES: lipopolysaccharide assembly protein LapA domain-containing protein [Paenibacillus]MCH1640959.1 lipopolysaccharide assembly protein LapA domain-containing protein [Paenibacillus timonensis]MDU2239046.1 lipopolysaccharide assembly protein LapA domain-containing protein [Paenibacillus sp.]